MQNRTWDEWFWLPERVTWDDVERKLGNEYPNNVQLWTWSLFFGFFLYLIRWYCVVPLLLEPIARKAGIRSRPYKCPPKEDELEVLYSINRARPPRKCLTEAASRIGWPERKVETWLRHKALSMQPTTSEKFCDQGWSLVFRVFNVSYALFLLLPQEYIWDSTKLMENYPFQKIPTGIWYFCAINCGFSIKLTLTILIQDRRRDFAKMMNHHLMSLLLYMISFKMNTIRLLTISITIHEIADIFLTSSKMSSYAKKDKLCDGLMLMFTVVWFCTRLVAYPLMVLVPMFTLKSRIGTAFWPSMMFGQVLGLLMLLLHIVWTTELLQVIKARLMSTEKFTDSRSSPEELSETENAHTEKKAN